MEKKNMKIVFVMLRYFSFILIQALKYHQTDYVVKSEIVQVAHYNASYFANVTCGLVHYNRTYRAVNASGYVLKGIGKHVKAEYQLYKFRSNEYRFFPITLEMNLCREIELDTFGIVESLQKSVNTVLRCPVTKGFYRMTYGMIDFSKFPPYIPPGQYKAEVKAFEDLDFLVEVHLYSTIEETTKKWDGVIHF